MNSIHRTEIRILSASLVFLIAWSVSTAHAQVIRMVNPATPSLDDLVTIAGFGFGDQPGRRVVALSWAPDGGGSFEAAAPGCRLPIVHWSDERILVLASGCVPRAYGLAIREDHGVGRRLSNLMPLTFRETEGPPPPAVFGGTPRLERVHPALVEPDRVLDVYGDFPFPDPSIDRIAIMKSLKGAAPTVPPQVVATLTPFEMSRPHLRVRLPAAIEPGEYMLKFVKNPVDRSNSLRFVIRSTQPAEWEQSSHLTGSSPVDFRLAGVVRNVGLERRSLDLLGVNLGAQPRGTVHWMTAANLDGVTWNLRHRDDPYAVLF